jgi:hypothetical protein
VHRSSSAGIPVSKPAAFSLISGSCCTILEAALATPVHNEVHSGWWCLPACQQRLLASLPKTYRPVKWRHAGADLTHSTDYLGLVKPSKPPLLTELFVVIDSQICST